MQSFSLSRAEIFFRTRLPVRRRSGMTATMTPLSPMYLAYVRLDRSQHFASRCGLCHDYFIEGEEIVLRTQNPTRCIFPGDQIIITLPDDRQYASHNSDVYCQVHESASHVDCFDQVPRKDYRRLLRIAERTFPTFPSERRFRETRRRDRMAPTLSRVLGLPLEIALQIAEFLTMSEHFVSRLAALCPLQRRAGHLKVDVSAPMVIEWSRFEGKSYVHHISRGEGPEMRDRPKLLFVAEDESGIRDMFTTCSGTPPSMKRKLGVWWKTITLHEDQYKVKFYHDGLKLRSLKYRSFHTRGRAIYSVPSITKSVWTKNIWIHSEETGLFWRNIAFTYNTPDMQGIGARMRGDSVVALFSHTADGIDEYASFYEAALGLSAEDIWIYIPLIQGERIVKWYHIVYQLAFETDRGRFLVPGDWHAMRDPMPWLELHIPKSTGPDTFYFNWDADARSQFCFPRSPCPEVSKLWLPPRTLSAKPEGCEMEGFFFSSASLSRVVSVRQCHRDDDGKREVIGLLLEDSDGVEATLGQVRIDSLTEPQLVDQDKKMWLAFWRTTELQLPYVSRVEFSKEMPVSGEEWFGTEWAGQIEWWFSTRQCQIWYDGSASLRTQMQSLTQSFDAEEQ